MLKFFNHKLFAIAWLLSVAQLSFAVQFAVEREEHKRDTLLYYYHDSKTDEFPDLLYGAGEDRYMELYLDNGILMNGFFWGASDEFDEVREGYECGFFVLPMTDIQHGQDSVTFRLALPKTKGGKALNAFVMAPVDLHIRSWKEAVLRYKQWAPFYTFMRNEIRFSISYCQGQAKEYSARQSRFQIADTFAVRNLSDDYYCKHKRIFVLQKKKH